MQVNQNNMATGAKTIKQPRKKSIIPLRHRKYILNAYYRLYNAFGLKSLAVGNTLGASSHEAIQLVRAKLATMDQSNPVTKFLLRVHARHSKRVAKRSMTSKYRNERSPAPQEMRTKIIATLAAVVNESLARIGKLSAIYAKHNQNMAVKPAQKAPVMPLKLKLQLLQKQRQHTA